MKEFEELDDFLVRHLLYFHYKKYVEQMNLQGNESILEIGSGGGNLSRFLAEKLPRGSLVCVDKLGYWIEKSKKRLEKFRNIEYKLNDVGDFKENGFFDLIVIHYVLHDIPNEKRKEAVNILKESLKEEGFIYLREPTRKRHGMPAEEIKELMNFVGLREIYSEENFRFLTGKYYSGIFQKYFL